MATHNLGVKWFLLDSLRSGRKDLEIRVRGRYIDSIHEGDTIIFNGREQRRVKKISHFASFDSAVTGESVKRIAPGRSRNATISFLRELHGRQEQRGVVVFELEMLGPPMAETGG
ncbi:hypothetical protein A3H16_01280 [Candidatus Kaiserbacteria bacterium RIFCSPLOWO2_12_FULL_53_8]|uniref:ASCH domain-containing protein n=2 Tax=Candidatus Kaiseribacteriota TaxID=1752734 RepID=A0A1F6CVV5_9BACT|nr:MAG: hypothetical protein A2851_03730 [Candidatus Kaiserbacteria bacterium RIFCSPHIGHO2_01_FULL_53_29]OGG92330.1 MAG: hypothetical protein A3H16_01280 [Candidatus Kaiserbacteria bacterium RIFCSPLOWO2_12_FULL_53_8]